MWGGLCRPNQAQLRQLWLCVEVVLGQRPTGLYRIKGVWGLGTIQDVLILPHHGPYRVTLYQV